MSPLFGHKKTLEELQSEEEEEKVYLSIDQMRALRARLRQEGLTVEKSFGGSVKAAWNWMKNH